MSNRKASAYHEAGHAVVSKLLGRGFKSVSIAEDGESLGRVLHYPPGEWFRPDIEVDALAGPLAEKRFTGSFNDPGSGSDMKCALLLASYVSKGEPNEAGAYVDWLRYRTLNLLNDPLTWPAVEALASRLMEVPTLGRRAALAGMQEGWDRLLAAHRAGSSVFAVLPTKDCQAPVPARHFGPGTYLTVRPRVRRR